MADMEQKIDALIALYAQQRDEMEKQIQQQISTHINKRENLDAKLDKVMYLNEKLDMILEKLEKQERRAKLGVVWKFVWIFLLVILPLYLSFKMMGSSAGTSFDGSSLTRLLDGVKEVQEAMPQNR